MQRYWLFIPWLPDVIDPDCFVRNPVANYEQVFQAGFGPHMDPKAMPIVDLRIPLKDFTADCFTFETRIFVSGRLRAVMNLDPGAVQYFEVDATRSAPKPRAMDYQVMNVPVLEAAADLDKSTYLQFPPLSPGLPPARHAQELHIRDDLATPHEIFVDSIFFHWICTEALALRILQAGCTGIRFVDPKHPIGNRMRFRTLRGVEADEWDEKSDDFVRCVVEQIH